ncbi:DedA family protein [Brevibacillus humidisoli]|uniref:DedA family protein n=1 Tax=Brevibacillus humidisoli TaxID=2895522 RepID=UPI001E5FAED5|nr:DedA family protein [Brevibacillus humidisoli]UFJ43208.1 DedA family protein [Brevibacillus humidisoli]
MIQPYIVAYGYFALFFLFFLGIIGMPLPEETLLVFSGFLVSIGQLELVQTILVCYLGSISAMTAAYWIGRVLGYPFVEKYGRRFGLGYAAYKRTEEWFISIGKWSLPIGYFIPGVRQFTAYFSGITKLPFPVFALFTYSGGLFWSALFVILGWQLGARWEQLFELIARNLAVFFLLLLAVILIWSWFRRRSREKNGRRSPLPRTKEEGTR